MPVAPSSLLRSVSYGLWVNTMRSAPWGSGRTTGSTTIQVAEVPVAVDPERSVGSAPAFGQSITVYPSFVSPRIGISREGPHGGPFRGYCRRSSNLSRSSSDDPRRSTAPINIDIRCRAYLPRNAPRTNPARPPIVAPMEKVTGPFLITRARLLRLPVTSGCLAIGPKVALARSMPNQGDH